MSDIKSAREIAMEKVQKLGEASDEERLRWKYVPEGEGLAAKYLEEGGNLATELSRYEKNVTRYVTAGMAEILVRNIDLPRDNLAKRNNRKAMDGLKTIKSDKVSVENVYSKLRRIFSHYLEQGEQQRKQAYEALKAEFEARIQQALQQQLGTFWQGKIDVEKQPQFQEEWHKIQTQLDSQYITMLNEHKQELLAIP